MIKVAGEIVRAGGFGHRSLTVYIANDYQGCERNITGERDKENGLLWYAYRDLLEKKRENSSIVLSIIGIENENEL